LLANLKGAMVLEDNHVEGEVIMHDYESIIEEALKQLSPQRSLVFRLSRYQGLKMEEIAQQLHLSRHTVKNHVVAARQFIRSYLARHGVIFLLLSFLLLK
jgi:RNA polymerase sigma-70 factor (ECF subfamily)